MQPCKVIMKARAVCLIQVKYVYAHTQLWYSLLKDCDKDAEQVK